MLILAIKLNITNPIIQNMAYGLIDLKGFVLINPKTELALSIWPAAPNTRRGRIFVSGITSNAIKV